MVLVGPLDGPRSATAEVAPRLVGPRLGGRPADAAGGPPERLEDVPAHELLPPLVPTHI